MPDFHRLALHCVGRQNIGKASEVMDYHGGHEVAYRAISVSAVSVALLMVGMFPQSLMRILLRHANIVFSRQNLGSFSMSGHPSRNG